MKKIQIKVSGMACEGCENRVKNVLSTIDGLESIEVNHKTGIVTVMSTKEIDKSMIEEKINNLGFETVQGD